MAYVYFPARETNYFPPGPPYLAGLRGFHGLGDYAADLAAYKADLAKWRLESIAYERAIKVRDAEIKTIDAAYRTALAQYYKDKATWDKEYAAYLVAYQSWVVANQQNSERSMKIAEAYGLNLTQGYYQSGACLSQAQHNEYARQCTTVKGIGRLRGLGASDPDCGMKALPVCTPVPTVRAKPVQPTKGAYPATPTLRAMPVEPTAPVVTVVTTPITTPVTTPITTPVVTTTSTPSSVPVPDSALTPEPEEAKQANVLMGGLIVAAVLFGGYLVYRTVKKPKAA